MHKYFSGPPIVRKIYLTFVKLKRRAMTRHIWAVRLAALALVVFVVLLALALFWRILVFAGVAENLSIARHFLFPPRSALEMHEDRTNVLVLGKDISISGAPQMTDTIIVISVPHDKIGDITMFSIPRDIWVPDLSDKINSAYHTGGLVLARSVVKDVLGVPIHYAMTVDFQVFVDLVDLLNGVVVDVERAFVDERFPIPGRENDECDGEVATPGELEFACRYETIMFEPGKQLMDGATALKFSRSRNSQDPEEGNDLARAARQQKVLSAIREELSKSEVFLSPSKLSALRELFFRNIHTDLTKSQMAALARKLYDSRANMKSYVLPEEFLEVPPRLPEYKNLFVFIPATGDWSEVHEWVGGALSD